MAGPSYSCYRLLTEKALELGEQAVGSTKIVLFGMREGLLERLIGRCLDYVCQTEIPQLLFSENVTATDEGNGYVHIARMGCNTADNLALQRLLVELPFTGHNEIGAFDERIEIRPLQKRFDSRAHARTKKDGQRHAEATGGAVTRCGEINIGVCFSNDVCETAHPSLELLDCNRIGSLLTAEHMRGAVLSEQRVGHVVHYRERRFAYDLVNAAFVDCRHARKVCTAPWKLTAVRIKKPHAKRPQEPHSPVVRAGTAQANGYPPTTVIERMEHALPHTVARGNKRIAFLVIQHCKPACRSRLDKRLVTIDEDPAPGRPHEAVVHEKRNAFALANAGNGIECTFAAISHSERNAFSLREYIMSGPFEQRTNSPARKRPLKRIGCEHEFHTTIIMIPTERIGGRRTMREVPAGHPEKPQGEDGFKLLNRMNGGIHEELALWGLGFIPIGETARILDIGCGGGANIERLLARSPRGHVTGIDYSPVSVQMSSEHNARAIEEGRCDVLEGNSSALPFPDSSFDVVTAFETTYYWDLPTAFPEVKRVLKPDGIFLICNEDDGGDPEVLELAEKIPGMVIHTPAVLEEALAQAGFQISATERIPEIGHLAIIASK